MKDITVLHGFLKRLYYYLLIPLFISHNGCDFVNNKGVLEKIDDKVSDAVYKIQGIEEDLQIARNELDTQEFRDASDEGTKIRYETIEEVNSILIELNGISIPFDQDIENQSFVVNSIRAVRIIWNNNLHPNLIFAAEIEAKDTIRTVEFGGWELLDDKKSIINKAFFFLPTKKLNVNPGSTETLIGNVVYDKLDRFSTIKVNYK